MQDARAITLNVMESLLLFVFAPQTGSKTCRWLAVSKLWQKKRIACEGEENENEITNAEATLLSIIGGKTSIGIENAQIELQKAGSSIQDLEEGLEIIFKQLIKARATILNILNH
ncbi:hypothetical protein SLEP1_g59439 [Rubroshorea leprosula]|uniref:Uncharacterized protein n=1 Tax=Rubroshorea leprosula TaxID=152421 RepID=A0AAV5MVK5_9ROSI|nr:hypothetical protein SLEP1_g59439 [Rubroshorea leprosula]